jgi:hypothetical protein
MITKAKTALIAAFVLGSASAALAQAAGEEFQNSQYQLNPAAPVPLYAQQVQQAPQALIEGRNVAITNRAAQAQDRSAPVEVDRFQSYGGN